MLQYRVSERNEAKWRYLMKHVRLLGLLGLLVGLMVAAVACSSSPGELETETDFTGSVSEIDLAEHWAPVFYHDTDDTNYRADYITKVDFDEDFQGNNNWDNLNNFSLPASVYYSVIETPTHWFIGYYVFHPRDWSETCIHLHCHENDFEGILLVIQRDGSKYGSCLLMETEAHNHLYQYTNNASITNGTDNIDGTVLFEDTTHPAVFIEAKGHGQKAYDGADAPGGDGIVYHHTGVAEEPDYGDGNWTRKFGYDLLPILPLWLLRNDIGDGKLYGSFGTFDGDDWGYDAAKPPWGWDDPDDGPTFIGDFISDPAHLVDTHLNGLGKFSHVYTSNPYWTHKVVVSSVASLSDRDPAPGQGASDVYVKVTATDGEKFWDADLWKFNEAAKGEEKIVCFGKDDAEEGKVSHSGSCQNTRYIARPIGVEIIIQVMDSDEGPDDNMGSVTAAVTTEWANQPTSSGEALVNGSITVR